MKGVLLIPAILLAAGFLFALGNAERGSAARTGQGGSVGLVASWSGSERTVLMDMLKPFTERTGIQVNYTGTRDISAVVTTRVAAGNAPDLAAFSNPGQMRELAARGSLVPLDDVLDMSRVEKAYSTGWIKLGSVKGRLYGIFTKAAAKGLIWYDVRSAAAVGLSPQTAPESWNELLDLSHRISRTGVTPWAIGLESGAASGWVGTDWLEIIFLRKYGPEEYQKWYEGRLAWTSPEVRSVWKEWGKIVAAPGMVYGGPSYMLSTNFGDAFAPLFETPPAAYLHLQATFITGYLREKFPDLVPVRDYYFFRFPKIDPRYAGSVEASGDVYTMFSRSPQARALIRYVSTADAQEYWLATGAISPNRMVPESAYADPITRQAAKLLNGSDIVAFDASDLMPTQMNQAFWNAVLEYVREPARLDRILADLERVRKEAYR
ncbi:ABC transporter substrate-binding protein [Salinispira pacifica]